MQCGACGHGNREQARFCDACGASLAVVAPAAAARPDTARAEPRSYTPAHLAERILTTRAALEGERKQVTVLFCDLVGSTELARRLGPEAMYETLNAFFDLAAAEVHRVEGTINQFLGDGFMALFGAPLAHEDHVARALHCALAIRQRLADAAAAGGRLALVRVRMGLNTGPVVVGRIGDNLRMDYTAIGDTTHIAARLQALADTGGICCSAAVQAAGAAQFEFDARGPQALKGLPAPVPVHVLLRARQGRADAGVQRAGIGSPLVGRAAEQARMARALGHLAQGTGGVLIVQGEPGHGKSRLLAEARRSWLDGPPQRLWLEGRSLSFGRNLSYWPFVEILKRAFGITEDEGEQAGWHKLRKGLRPLFGERADEVLPYIATVLALPVPAPHDERVKYLDGPALKRQLFLGMRQLTELLLRRQPLVLALEDWHWADPSSVDLAEHLLPLAATLPLLVVFATRAEPEGPVQRMRQAAAALAPMPLHELALPPLDAACSAQLLANLVGAQALPAPLREQVLRKTEGNPLFIEEVVRSLVADGVLQRNASGWELARRVEDVQLPDTLQALILSRIDRLDDESKHAVKLASVIGRSFYERVLEAIAEARVALDHCIAELQRAELIREKQRQPDLEYIFKHALVQEAAYGSMLAENRRAIHRHVAHAIERLFPDRLDEFASLLAHHYTCAEDWEHAHAWLFKAGDQAGRMAADDEALDHLRRAEAAYLKAHGAQLAPLQRAALARKVGTALFGTSQYEAAHAQMRQALAHLGVAYPATRGGVLRAVLREVAAHVLRLWRARLGLAAPRRLDLATATELSTIANTMAWTDYFLDKERMLLDSLLELQAGERSDHALAEARGLSAVGFGLMTYGARALARRYHTRALALAQRSGHASAIAFAWMALAFVDFYDGAWDAFEDRMGRAVTGFRESGDLHRWGSPVMMVAWAGIARGRLAAATQSMREAVQIGIDAADPQITSWALQVLGRALLFTGPLSEAEAVLRRGCAIARDIHSIDNLLHLQAMLVECLVMQDRLDEGEPLLAEAFQVMRRERMERDFDRIELQVADALHALARAGLPGAEAAALQRAGRACGAALRSARRMPLWLPQALRLHGSALWLAGHRRGARAAWDESLAQADAQGFPIERGLTLLERGRRLQDPAAEQQARELFQRAGAQVPLALCSRLPEVLAA